MFISTNNRENWERPMDIGHRLRVLREEKKLSQGDIEKRTGLLRCYISRVENSHTIPFVETLIKRRALCRCLSMFTAFPALREGCGVDTAYRVLQNLSKKSENETTSPLSYRRSSR